MDEFDNIIMLNDEDGNEVRFEFCDMFEYGNNEYVVLLPADEEADEVVILRVERHGREDKYVGVEDEAVLERVFRIFKERNKDEFNFVD